MSKADFELAEQLARDLLQANMIVEPPVIAAELAEGEGLEVGCTKFKPEYSHIAGFIDTEKMTIVVNSADSQARQNFTIAHELGHFLMKHHEQDGYEVLLRNPSAMKNTPMEQEANCFAANLLVPMMFLREYIENFPRATNQQLADIFGVSTDVIRFRKLYQ